MEYVEAPAEYAGKGKSIFLAGSITGAPDWQGRLARLLADEEIVIFNPRRKDFPINNPNEAENQIGWEYRYLRKASAISFWFAKETLSPISLYELGAWLAADKPIFLGVDPRYQRGRDIEIQAKLARPELRIASSLDSLAVLIKNWIEVTG
jgi:hypothetical protein